jgi:hypothetical protein
VIDYPDRTPEEEALWAAGDLTKIELPDTHFPDPTGEWHLVHNGLVMPVLNQEIMYVVDIRGSQSEFNNDLMKWPFENQEVRHGYVDDVGFSTGMNQWHISVRSLKHNRGASHIDYGDHITYWRPMPQPPADTFKRHAFMHFDVWKISQAKLIANGE